MSYNWPAVMEHI